MPDKMKTVSAGFARLDRRDVIAGGIATVALNVMSCDRKLEAPVKDTNLPDQQAFLNRALAEFPYELVQVPGENALTAWSDLKRSGRGTPVVLGSDDDLVTMSDFAEFFSSGAKSPDRKSPAQILEKAKALAHPQSLREWKAKETAKAREALRADCENAGWFPSNVVIIVDENGKRRPLTREELRAALCDEDEEIQPEIREWPSHPPSAAGLSVAKDVSTGAYHSRVHIALIPTDDWTEIPAYLHFGGWNDCPPPEHHVAALRSWRERYGAELIGLSYDTMNIRVSRKPATREEALALAREQYDYCYDIVEQGVETLSNLAASLKAHDWWYFWWD